MDEVAVNFLLDEAGVRDSVHVTICKMRTFHIYPSDFNFYEPADALMSQLRMSRKSRCARDSDMDKDKFQMVRIMMSTRQSSNMPFVEFSSENGGEICESRTGMTSGSFLFVTGTDPDSFISVGFCSPGSSRRRNRGGGSCKNRAGKASANRTIFLNLLTATNRVYHGKLDLVVVHCVS